MYAQCDIEGNQYLLLDAIVDHRRYMSAIDKSDGHITKNGKKFRRRTTTGWRLCVQWKDGTTSWEKLADLKESYPLEVAEYAISREIDDQPAFAWWVPYVLKKRNRMISAVRKRYHKTTHKFGFEVPKTVRRAHELDKENGNTRWRDAIVKEMDAVKTAFKMLDEGKDPPPGYQQIDCHMIFDIKMEDFRRKALPYGADVT